jgi:prepilin-type N-terminal cleavage/methylation domain-containing protein
MKASNAFTLIEIMLVVIILGIISALAAPNFSKGYSRFELNRTADDLLNCSRWAQAMAIGQERTYALSFSHDHRSYALARMKTGDVSDDSQKSFEPVNGALGRMHRVPETVSLDTRNDRIEFYPDGTIDPAKIKLSCPEQKIILSSAQVRGMMTKEGYEQ